MNKGGLDEVYACDFRNPYRFSFDMRGNHRLYVGDAGQELWEEINKGDNYGWNVMEGIHCFDAENAENPPADCPDVDQYEIPLIDPFIEFKHSKQVGGLSKTINRRFCLLGKGTASVKIAVPLWWLALLF